MTKQKIELSGFEDIFSVGAPQGGEHVQTVALTELHAPDLHPFQVNDDEAMTRLVESVKRFGVREPGLVRQRTEGAYELLCGNRRKGGIHKNILTKSFELYGRKNADNKTKQLIAKLLSYPTIGVAAALIIAGMAIGAGNMTVGFAVLGVGTLLILVLPRLSLSALPFLPSLAFRLGAPLCRSLPTSRRIWPFGHVCQGHSLEIYKKFTVPSLDKFVLLR